MELATIRAVTKKPHERGSSSSPRRPIRSSSFAIAENAERLSKSLGQLDSQTILVVLRQLHEMFAL
jgi:hypothetical protein